jgi:tetratricopeptide (TPR) repeat protein
VSIKPHAAFPVLAALALTVAACGTPEERAAEYLARAQQYWDQGDINRATVEARNAVQVQPKNAKARYLLALASEKKGEIDAMLNHLAVVIEVDPGNAPAKVKLGTYLVNAQDYQGARLIADEALALTPDDPEALILKARVLISGNDIPAAIEQLNRAIELSPANVDAAGLRAVAYTATDPERGLADVTASIERVGEAGSLPLRKLRVDMLSRLQRVAEVEAELRKLVAEYPAEGFSDPLALFLVSQNRMDDAEQVLREAVAADPANYKSKVNLAQFQARYRQRPEEAEKTLRQFIEDDPDNLQLPVWLGSFYEAGDRLEEASAAYEKVASKAPKTPEGIEARNRLVAIALRTGKVDDAKDRLEGILQDAPDDVNALLIRGEIAYAAGRNEDAIADLRAVLRRQPDNQLGLLLLAKTHTATGDRPLAEDAYRRLLRIAPNDTEALASLAGLLGEGGQLEEAADLYQKALGIDPKNAQALEGIVGLSLARKDLKAAEQNARALVALDDPNGVGQRELGRVLEAQQKWPEANEAYKKSLERKPDSAFALEGIVRTLQESRRLDDATAYLRAHLERHPDHVLARVLLGGNLIRAAQFKEAQVVLEQAIEQQPQLVRAYAVLAGAYPDDAKARQAVFRRGLDANPKAGSLAILLASEYQVEGRYDDAIALYDEMLKSGERMPQVSNGLAMLLLDKRTDAESHKRALELAKPFANTESSMFLDTLGWAYYRNKDYDSAIRYLELAIVFGRNEPEVRYHLGLAYLASGNKVGAQQELEKAVKEGRPGAPWAADAKKALESLASAAPPAAPAQGTG